MTVHLNKDILSSIGLNDEGIKLELAIALYQQGKLSMGQASRLAEIPYVAFQFELGKREIPINYDVEQLKEDIDNLKNLNSP